MTGPFRPDELEGADDVAAIAERADALVAARMIEAALSDDRLRPGPGAAFTDRVMTAVAAAPAPRGRSIRGGTLVLAAALALGSLGGLIAAGGLGLLDQTPAPSPEVTPSPTPAAPGSPSPSPSPSSSPSPSLSRSPTASPTPSRSPSVATSPPPTATGTTEPAETETPSPTGTDDSGGGNSGPGGGGGGG